MGVSLDQSILIGNGININFGGNAYTNEYIIKRIVFNARANKYDSLFNGSIKGDDIAHIFVGLGNLTNEITRGKYDNIVPEEEKQNLEDFKARYNWKLEHYYEVGLEDWLFILHVFFLSERDISSNWKSAKQGFECMMLDAIYNDGDIQNLHKRMKPPVKRWLKQYDKIFTLNYDNNVEDLIKRPVYHLHGNFRTLASSEDPNTLLGYIRCQKRENIKIPAGFEHCFCNALLDYAGEHKYEIAHALEQGENGLKSLSKNSFLVRFLPTPIEELMRTYHDHPELSFGCNYHFTDFENLTGEIHIIGMSPNNDAHIFKLIDKSNIKKVVFFYYSDAEVKKKIPVHQQVEYKSARELWGQLDALPKQNNCHHFMPDSENLKAYFAICNEMSGDSVSYERIIANVNSIPQFKAKELCEIVMKELQKQKAGGPLKNETEQQMQFREISRIALRNGILPSALFLLVVMYKNANRHS